MTKLKPKARIRRFDVFAEYNRLRAIKDEHLSAAKAKGYGLWVAKVVAAQKFGRLPKPTAEKMKTKSPEERKKEKQEWHKLGGVTQTDKLFDKEITSRMGKDFYTHIFSPAIQKAFEEGSQYRDIRDTIRSGWKPDSV
jgi:hypothetical protein